MRKILTTVGKAAAAASLVASVCPAFALEAGPFINQVEARPFASAWQIDQVPASTIGIAYLAQVEPVLPASDHAFQAFSGETGSLNLVFAEQLAPSLSSRGQGAELAFLGMGLDLGPYLRSGSGTAVQVGENGNRAEFAWSGSDNLQIASLTGSNNLSVQRQEGLMNVSLIIQSGQDNSAMTTQLADNAYASILQYGTKNEAVVFQGSDSAVALISQNGTANLALVRQ